MTRWKLTIEYDGGAFCGWQRQAEGVTVQQTLEEAVRAFTGEDVTLHVAGRTDAGVHARGQVAHMDLTKDWEPGTIRDAMNFHARARPVAVLGAEKVASGFHARFGARQRRYRYTILNRRAPAVLEAGRVWHVPQPLALAPMQEAAGLLIGRHDFSTFRAQGCQASSPLRTLDLLTIRAVPDAETIILDVAARSFLYHQVRNMAGTLALVGLGRWSVQDVAEALAAADRRRGGPTAPPQGLCLEAVLYSEAEPSTGADGRDDDEGA